MNELLAQGMAAARAGHKDEARTLLLHVLKEDEQNEVAWLWLSGVTRDPEEMRVCLENVLILNPENARARKGLDWIAATYGARPATPTEVPAPVPTTPVADPLPTAVEPAPSAVVVPAIALAPAPPAPPAFPLSSKEAADRQAERAAVEPVEPVACVYCGTLTSPAQTNCPGCRRNLMVRVGAPEKRSAPLVILAVMTGLSAVSSVLLGGLMAIGGLLFATISANPAQLEAELRDLPAGTTLPGGMDPLSLISLLGTFLFAFAITLLLVGVLYIFVTVGLWRRRRWAYYVTCVLVGLSLLIALITVPFAIYADGLSANTLFSLFSTIGYVVVTVMSYGDFFGPQVRLLPEVVTRDAVSHYNTGIAYKNRGMWYMAAQEWAAAVTLSPKDLVYLHALGLAYAQIKQYDQARATLDTAISIAPHDSQLAASRALVDELAGSAQS